MIRASLATISISRPDCLAFGAGAGAGKRYSWPGSGKPQCRTAGAAFWAAGVGVLAGTLADAGDVALACAAACWAAWRRNVSFIFVPLK